MRDVLIGAAVAATLAGCAVASPRLPPEGDAACGVAGRTLFIAIDPAIPRQGATLRITPKRDNQPAGELTLPPQCVSHWTISGPATFDGHHTAIAIAGRAPPSRRRARCGRAHRCAWPKLGRTLLGSVACARARIRPGVVLGDLPAVRKLPRLLGHLHLRRRHRSARAESHRRQQHPPNLVLAGTAHIVGGQLIIEGMYLGDLTGRPAPAACRYVF
jgi:hypothetical protein